MINKCKICGKEFEAVESREACCSEACKEEYVAMNSGLVGGDMVLDKYGNVMVALGQDVGEDYYDEDGWHYIEEEGGVERVKESLEERKAKLRSKWGALYK